MPFETTAEAPALDTGDVIGQDRAVDALQFGVGIERPGYNLFAIGPAGVGKRTLLQRFLREHAGRAEVPTEWCYAHNFSAPERPLAIELPAGMGGRLQQDMDRAVVELGVTMRTTFESEEYRTRRRQIVGRYKERQQRALSKVQEQAKQRDVAVLETDMGIVLAPIKDGSALDSDDIRALPEREQGALQVELTHVSGVLHELLRRFHGWGREKHEELKALDEEMAATAAHKVYEGVRTSYAEHPAVLEHLERVELDAADSADDFLEGGSQGVESALKQALEREQGDQSAFRRYRINLLEDRSELEGAPVVCEDNPTYANLIGRIEHETQFGALITNFTLIRAGALHRAIGGYLILDAVEVLRHPFSWDALKRTIRSGEIRMESLGQTLGLVHTVSLDPASIPFGRTKIVLCGERPLYYLLSKLDPDLLELFKVLVDFEESMARQQPEAHEVYAMLVATLVGKEELRPFDRGAVARIIDQAARVAGDTEKLSVQMRGIVELLRETDYWAGAAGHDVATAEDVQRAIDTQIHRSDRVRQRLQEAVRREDILLSTSGEAIGQVNGLSVFQLGEHAFGRPTRITARVRLGRGEVVDIEREVELGGPLHSKGVLILSGFLGSRYATRFPLSLSASLVFEQSYGSVDGDSASLAELCALLSSLAEVSVRQSFAITGSVNQWGQVQSIGGVNEKIEGFFDVCKERGLTGEQGVLIPRTNVKNLMLRADIVEAVETNQFQIHATETVDDTIELLTGRAAGERDAAGAFPEGSINALVEARLRAFAECGRSFLPKSTSG